MEVSSWGFLGVLSLKFPANELSFCQTEGIPMGKALPRGITKGQKEEEEKDTPRLFPASEPPPCPLSLPAVHGLQGQPLLQLPAASTYQLQPHCWKLSCSVYGT